MRARNPKQLKFVEKGKYIAQASALRRQVALEQMRKRIAASTKKASLDEDPSEKHFIVEKPEKDVEWWDEGLLDSYVEIDKGLQLDTKLTSLVQHPVALEPPQDRHAPAPRPLPLTSREQAKLRRQRRMVSLARNSM